MSIFVWAGIIFLCAGVCFALGALWAGTHSRFVAEARLRNAALSCLGVVAVNVLAHVLLT